MRINGNWFLLCDGAAVPGRPAGAAPGQGGEEAGAPGQSEGGTVDLQPMIVIQRIVFKKLKYIQLIQA